MLRFSELVLVCLVTLSYIQLGRSDCHCDELQVQLAESISNLENHTASVLADLQSHIDEYKNQTATELADLRSHIEGYKNQAASELATLHASLQVPSVIDAISAAVLQLLLPHINNMTEIVSERIGETERSLSKAFEEHKNQTASELADLHASLQLSTNDPPVEEISAAVVQTLQPQFNRIKETISQRAGAAESPLGRDHTNCTTSDIPEQFTQLHEKMDAIDSELTTVSTHLDTQIISLQRHVDSKIDSLDSKLSGVSRDFDAHKNQTASELADLHISLQSATDHSAQELMQLSAKTDRLYSELVSSNSQVGIQFGSLERHIDGVIDPLNTTLSIFMSDFKEHKTQTASELADLGTSLHSDLDTNSEQLTQVCDKVKALSSKLTSANVHMNEDFSSLESQVNVMIDSMNTISTSLAEHDNHTTSELVSLDQHLQMNTEFLDSCKCPPIHTCGGTGGWRQVAYLDMKVSNTKCPEGWNMTDYSKRTCGRASKGDRIYGHSCDSVTYSVCGGEYSQVCGRIKAYQWGWTAAFRGNIIHSVNKAYFSGVAVMHGSPRQHIWTFATGATENYSGGPNGFLCPCDVHSSASVPPFVGDDYFCESGISNPLSISPFTLHSNDTLWDGKDCHSSSTCCSLHKPPFFTKTLSTPTTDDLELRMCLYRGLSNMNIAVELIEMYVK